MGYEKKNELPFDIKISKSFEKNEENWTGHL